MTTTIKATTRIDEGSKSDALKAIVREKYGEIAEQSRNAGSQGGCGCGCSSAGDGVMNLDYSGMAGYAPQADLALGCGIPTSATNIREGATVLDLGSGAGNDAFVARGIVGATGKVIGVDMTPAMVRKARENARYLGFNNVEFREGDIENLPALADEADVIVSNCVLNLVPDKKKAFAEIYRALKPGGHFGISDIVLRGVMPEALREAAEMYAGCVSGAIQEEEYLNIVRQTGFANVRVASQRVIELPDELLLRYVSPDALAELRAQGTAVVSITVYAEKPSLLKN